MPSGPPSFVKGIEGTTLGPKMKHGTLDALACFLVGAIMFDVDRPVITVPGTMLLTRTPSFMPCSAKAFAKSGNCGFYRSHGSEGGLWVEVRTARHEYD